MKLRRLFLVSISFITSSLVFAQPSTFSHVNNIIQGNCVTACHGGPNPSGQLDLSGSQTDVYNAIVGVVPTNPAAISKGYEQIKPGYPEKSFIMQKINNGLFESYSLDPSDGNPMPVNQPALSNEEIELINTWILHGASLNDSVVNPQTISNYYSGSGLTPLGKPQAPDTSEGIQIFLGSILLDPLEEVEYFLKKQLIVPDSVEVDRIEAFLDQSSHHYLIYKFASPSDAAGVPDGLVEVGITNAFPNADLVAAWQDSKDLNLPDGTAYFWEPNPNLLLNYHIKNYSTDSVLKGNAYANVYFKKKQPNTIQMHAGLIAANNIFTFNVPNDNQDHLFSDSWFEPALPGDAHIWMLASHTHKYGVDFDIFLRNPDGTKGTQVYEGYYNTNYTFNQGYYDWEHPATKYFEPLMAVPFKDGLIQEATYNNYGNAPVTWGLTTNDEMMLFFIQYTTQAPSSSVELSENDISENILTVFPNPTSNTTLIALNTDYKDTNSNLQILDIRGKIMLETILTNSFELNPQEIGMASGVYFIRATANNKSFVKKLIVR